jgi:hypothetical protein
MASALAGFSAVSIIRDFLPKRPLTVRTGGAYKPPIDGDGAAGEPNGLH